MRKFSSPTQGDADGVLPRPCKIQRVSSLHTILNTTSHQHTPTRASQGDVGTRSNASTSTACQTRTAQAAASGRNDILFQPCITRRQGSETNVARTPGVSQQAPPERKPMPIADMPYIGDFRGCTWNAQALFARRASRQCPKQRQVRKLLQNHDFLAVQETHSTEGGVLAFECPAGTAARWSHGTTQRAGIGLLLQDSFLSNFNVLQEGDWEDIEAGRAAVLHLRGPQGSLDIWVLYMATGEDGRNERAVTRQTLHHAIRSQTDTLTIMTGDFNYVVADRDRFCKETGSWSGRRDQIEEAEFTEKIADPFGLYELEQGHMTQENARARSRIDRVYLNQHIADQLDGHYGCAALPWVGNLSAHRPLSFFRRRPRKRGLPNAHLATGPINDPSWPTRVALHCAELRKEDARNDQPLRRLFLLKRAIQEVTDKMHYEVQATAAGQRMTSSAGQCGSSELQKKYASAQC